MKWREVFYAVLALLVLAVIFQLFFRYQYVSGGDGFVWRVDRLTRQSCLVGIGSVRCHQNQ
jgi:hypothetical protein